MPCTRVGRNSAKQCAPRNPRSRICHWDGRTHAETIHEPGRARLIAAGISVAITTVVKNVGTNLSGTFTTVQNGLQ